MLLKTQNRSLRTLVEVPSPGNGTRNGRKVLVEIGVVLRGLKERLDRGELVHVLFQNVLVAIRNLLLNGAASDGLAAGHRSAAAAANLLEVLHELEGSLGRAQLAETVLDEQLGHLLDLHHTRAEAFHDALPRLLVGLVKDLLFEGNFQRHGQVVHALDDFVDTSRVASHGLQLGAEEDLEMVQGFDDLQDVGVDFTHVVGLAEEGLAVKLTAQACGASPARPRWQCPPTRCTDPKCSCPPTWRIPNKPPSRPRRTRLQADHHAS